MQLRDLHRQYEAMKAEIDAALLGVAASGSFILGDVVAGLERQLADYVGVKHCVTCASCTDALRMALMVLGIGPGDAVFVPDFTFFASAEAVASQGATPIFVDVCEDDFNIDVDDLSEKIAHVNNHTDLRHAAVSRRPFRPAGRLHRPRTAMQRIEPTPHRGRCTGFRRLYWRQEGLLFRRYRHYVVLPGQASRLLWRRRSALYRQR